MYEIKESEGLYYIYKNGEHLLTPMFGKVRTLFKPLADKLIADLEVYGESPTDPISMVAFHYAMIDFHYDGDRNELRSQVEIGFNELQDWTFICPTATPGPLMQWLGYFMRPYERVDEFKDWLKGLTPMQLCAVTVVGRGLESVNIPFILGSVNDKSIFEDYAKFVDMHYPYIGVEDLVIIFENFFFYFNVDTESERV